jgi:hypothetical protein
MPTSPPEEPSNTLVPTDESGATLPDYLAASPRSHTPRREEIRLLPEELPPATADSRTPRALRPLLVLIPLALMLMVAVVGFGASAGRDRWAEAQAAVIAQQEELSRRMDDELRLRDELAAIGVEREALDRAFADWATADHEPGRSQRALAFLALVEVQVGAHDLRSNPTHEAQMVVARVERLRTTRRALADAERAGAMVQARLEVQLARALGLITP